MIRRPRFDAFSVTDVGTVTLADQGISRVAAAIVLPPSCAGSWYVISIFPPGASLVPAGKVRPMTTLREAGLKLIFDGLTTIDEVVRETVMEDVD